MSISDVSTGQRQDCGLSLDYWHHKFIELGTLFDPSPSPPEVTVSIHPISKTLNIVYGSEFWQI